MLIKSITTNRYSVELIEDIDSQYTVLYTHISMPETKVSESINDFYMASYIFDVKVQELEGQ